MNVEWKEAIWKKRKYAKQFSKNPTQEKGELKNKWRNIATKYRRKAIKQYWERKTDDFNNNLAEFYKTFEPFLEDKLKAVDKCITLEKYGNVIFIRDH